MRRFLPIAAAFLCACHTFTKLSVDAGASSPDAPVDTSGNSMTDGDTGEPDDAGDDGPAIVLFSKVVSLAPTDRVNDIAVTMTSDGPVAAGALTDRVAFFARQPYNPLTVDGTPEEVAIRAVGPRFLVSVTDDSGDARLQIGDLQAGGLVEVTTGATDLHVPVISGDGARFDDGPDIVAQHFQTEGDSYISTFNAASPDVDQQIYRETLADLDLTARYRMADTDDGRWVLFRGVNSIFAWDVVQDGYTRTPENDAEASDAIQLILPSISEKPKRLGLARIAPRTWVVAMHPTFENNGDRLTLYYYTEQEADGSATLESEGEGPGVDLPGLVDFAATGMPSVVYAVWTDGSSIELRQFEGEDTGATELGPITLYNADAGTEIRDVEISGAEQDVALAWHEVDDMGVHRIGRATIAGP
jgi:hypothetical protein